MTLIRPLNKGQGHSFWYQSISYVRYEANVLFTGVVRSDLSAWSSSDWCLSETQQTLRILCW